MKPIHNLLLIASCTFAPVAEAELLVIANPSVKAQALTSTEIRQIFLGYSKFLPDGTPVEPLDQTESSGTRTEFQEKVLKKTNEQVRSYWTRIIFTGKGHPPKVVGGAEDVLRTVSAKPGAIAYIDSKDVPPGRFTVLFSTP